jgi:hypothetical protein
MRKIAEAFFYFYNAQFDSKQVMVYIKTIKKSPRKAF